MSTSMRAQDKVQERLEKMRAIQQRLTEADLARREVELAPQIAALEAKRSLDQIWMHVRLACPQPTWKLLMLFCLCNSSQWRPSVATRLMSGMHPAVACAHARRPSTCVQVDMDAFYASCEERDDPTLASVPVASVSPPPMCFACSICSWVQGVGWLWCSLVGLGLKSRDVLLAACD